MPDVPYPITATNADDLKRQIYELVRELFEERIGGLTLGDIFEDSGGVLTLRLGASNPCLQKVANALQVEIKTAGGLQATSTGVAAKLKTAGGLDVDSEGLFVSSSAYGFGTINCPSGNDPVADATNDTLNLVEGSGITITGDSSTDSVTIASTVTRATLGIDTTDSPAFSTVKLSGLTDGYIPKHTNDATGLENSLLQQTAAGLVTTAAFNAGSIVRYTPFTYFV